MGLNPGAEDGLVRGSGGARAKVLLGKLTKTRGFLHQ
jgi:hypothetical protein